MNTNLRIWLLSSLSTLFSSTTFAVTIDSVYIDHYRLAEIGTSICPGCGKMSEERTKVQTYSDIEPGFFSASTSANAYSNVGSNSVSASAGGWIRAKEDSFTNNYMLEGRASVYLFDWKADFNASSYGQTSFNQWMDFTVPEDQSYHLSTQQVQQLTNPDFILNYFMETKLFVISTGEVIFSGTTNIYSQTNLSLTQYKGQTLRFQTSGDIEALMPANINISNSGSAFTIDSRLYLQPVPIPASIWLLSSGIIVLFSLSKKQVNLCRLANT